MYFAAIKLQTSNSDKQSRQDRRNNNRARFGEKDVRKDALPSKTPLISLLTKLSSIITIDKNSTVEEAAYVMLKNGVRHLPVTEGNRKDIIGIITTTDFAKYLERTLESSDSQSSLLLQALCTEEEPTEERDIP